MHSLLQRFQLVKDSDHRVGRPFLFVHNISSSIREMVKLVGPDLSRKTIAIFLTFYEVIMNNNLHCIPATEIKKKEDLLPT